MNYKKKLSIYSGFLIVNILLSIGIATRYFFFMPELPSGALGLAFIVTSLIGQMALLGALIGLIGWVATLFPQRIFFLLLSFLASLTLSILVIDTFVFSQYRFHINEVVLKLVLSGDVVDFSFLTWLTAALFFVLMMSIEFLILLYLKKRISQQKPIRKKALVTVFIVSFFTFNFIHIWAAANAYQPVQIVKNYLPLFQPATANGFMRKHGWINEEALAQQKALSLKVSSDLNYPRETLSMVSVDKPVNILFLIVDSWRFDTFNADNTPNLWSYSQGGVTFSNHMSTGNATRTGIFGLFYGMPATYWQSFLSNQKSPVFMDRLQELQYQLGIFASASLTDPEFNRTVFSKISDLRLRSEGASPAERDQNLTEDWLRWYQARDKSKPTFSFLFYDAPHGYDFPNDYDKQYTPMLSTVNYLALNNDTDPTPFMNRYKTSVRYVDDLAKKVLDELRDSGETENTIVVITGDHAQELNDNKLNYWGHNSNFTAAQIHVPFVIIGPGFSSADSRNIQALTSHEDIVPTLMKNYLGVNSPIDSYSEGLDLLHGKIKRDWVLSSSYSGYAMITKDSILEVGAGGQYNVYDLSNRVQKDVEPNYTYLKDALESISRFKK